MRPMPPSPRNPTSSSSSPTTWVSPTPAVTAARSRRRISTGWPAAACGSRSSTTRPAAGRRGRAFSPAIMPSRSAATHCPASRGRRRQAPRLGPAAAGVAAPAGLPLVSLGQMARGRQGAGGRDSTAPIRLTITTAISIRGNTPWTISPCRPSSPAAATTPRRPSPSMRSTCWPSTRRSIADQPFFLYLAFTCPHFPAACAAAGHRRLPRPLSGRAGTRCGRSATAQMKKMGLVNCPLSKLDPDIVPSWNLPEEKLARANRSGRSGPGRALERA